MIMRRLMVIAIAALLGVQVVRNAAVGMFATTAPDQAARWWAGHPDVQIANGMVEIARAARVGRAVQPTVLEQIYRAAPEAPLAPEPFLVRGVQAQLVGDGATAQRALEAAQLRDPRSLPAAYFLADRYFRNRDSLRGLQQIALVSRLAPSGATTVAPYLATYARDPSTWIPLRAIFRADPKLRGATLVALAKDPANAGAVLALAPRRDPQAKTGWLPELVGSLITAGQYRRARAIWAQTSGVRLQPGVLLYDSGFSDASAPPPFNWLLTSSTAGLAERQPGGRLHLLFYGQEDGMLVRQLMLLPAGTYRLSYQLLGEPDRARALSWSIRCDKPAQSLASATLDVAARGWVFRVPPGCAAQWLELSGTSSDMGQQSDITVSRLKLEPGAAGA